MCVPNTSRVPKPESGKKMPCNDDTRKVESKNIRKPIQGISRRYSEWTSDFNGFKGHDCQRTK